VRYTDHCHISLQLRPERRLDHRIRLVIDRGRRLVQDQQLTLSHDRSSQCNDLPLPDGQVPAAGRDLTVERQPALVCLRLECKQASRTQGVVQLDVVVIAEHVQVLPERPGQELRCLRDNRHVAPKCVEVQGRRRQAVVVDFAVGDDASEKGERECALARSGAAYNADALAGLDLEGEVVEHDRAVGGVTRRQVLDSESTRRGPVCGRNAVLGRCRLVVDLEVGLDPLDTVGFD
jgi:hypothetical protein